MQPLHCLIIELLLEEVDDICSCIYMPAAYLSVSVPENNLAQDGVERYKLEMLQYWLDCVERNYQRYLDQLNTLNLAARLKLRTIPATMPDGTVCVCVSVWKCVCVGR